MGFVFAARMIAEAILHNCKKGACNAKKRGGVGGNATPHLQTDSLYDGAIFLKDSLHGKKKGVGVGGGRSPPPPHLQTSFPGFWVFENLHLLTPLSRVLKGSIWVLSLLVRRYLKRLCGGFWHLPSLDIVTVFWSYDYGYY